MTGRNCRTVWWAGTYLTQNDLLQRGWALSVIRNLLGRPDKFVPDNRYRADGLIYLYRIDRVLEIESTEEFERKMQIAQRRSQGQLLAHESRKQATLNLIESLNIRIPLMERSILNALAGSSENDVNRFITPRREIASAGSFSSEDLNRLAVNYLRNRCANYDDNYAQLRRRIGNRAARLLMKTRLLEEIGRIYPELSAECERQLLE